MSTTLMQWSDALNTGVADIDEQHKRLVALFNTLKQAIIDRRGSQVCTEILDQLVDYTQVHFRFEEELMQASGYSLYDSHKKLHDELLAQIHAYRQKLLSESGSISFDLLRFMQAWLTKHICDKAEDVINASQTTYHASDIVLLKMFVGQIAEAGAASREAPPGIAAAQGVSCPLPSA